MNRNDQANRKPDSRSYSNATVQSDRNGTGADIGRRQNQVVNNSRNTEKQNINNSEYRRNTERSANTVNEITRRSVKSASPNRESSVRTQPRVDNFGNARRASEQAAVTRQSVNRRTEASSPASGKMYANLPARSAEPEMRRSTGRSSSSGTQAAPQMKVRSASASADRKVSPRNSSSSSVKHEGRR